MSNLKVRRLLTNTLFAGLGGDENTPPKYPILLNGVQTEPEDSITDTNIIAHLIPMEPFSETLDGRDHTAYVGIYQMKVRTDPLDNGMLHGEEVVEELQAIFQTDMRILEQPTNPDSFAVQVMSPMKTSEGKQIGAWWEINCYFDYRADTN